MATQSGIHEPPASLYSEQLSLTFVSGSGYWCWHGGVRLPRYGGHRGTGLRALLQSGLLIAFQSCASQHLNFGGISRYVRRLEMSWVAAAVAAWTTKYAVTDRNAHHQILASSKTSNLCLTLQVTASNFPITYYNSKDNVPTNARA